MSGSVIFVWDPVAHCPLPKSIDEALERSDTLLNLASPPSAAVLAFAERLNAYLSENREQFEDDPIFMEAYNGFYSKVSGMQFACLPLETPFHARQRFLWAVVTLAQEQALVVTDEILGMAYLPGGKVYPTAKAKLWKGLDDYFKLGLDSDFPTTLAGFRKIIEPRIVMLLMANKFTKVNTLESGLLVFERKFGDITQIVRFLCQVSTRGFIGVCSLCIKCDSVSDICMRGGFPVFLDWFILSWSLSAYNLRISDDIVPNYMNSANDVDLYLDAVDNYVLKVLDHSTNLYGLNRVVNGGEFNYIKESCYRDTYMPVALALSRLSDDGLFESLSESLLKSGSNWNVTLGSGVGFREAWSHLVKYLRDEVQPLQDPVA